MDSRKIGKLIESKRKEKSMTQKELGLKINVSDKTISKWESGLGLPDISSNDKEDRNFYYFYLFYCFNINILKITLHYRVTCNTI